MSTPITAENNHMSDISKVYRTPAPSALGADHIPAANSLPSALPVLNIAKRRKKAGEIRHTPKALQGQDEYYYLRPDHQERPWAGELPAIGGNFVPVYPEGASSEETSQCFHAQYRQFGRAMVERYGADAVAAHYLHEVLGFTDEVTHCQGLDKTGDHATSDLRVPADEFHIPSKADRKGWGLAVVVQPNAKGLGKYDTEVYHNLVLDLDTPKEVREQGYTINGLRVVELVGECYRDCLPSAIVGTTSNGYHLVWHSTTGLSREDWQVWGAAMRLRLGEHAAPLGLDSASETGNQKWGIPGARQRKTNQRVTLIWAPTEQVFDWDSFVGSQEYWHAHGEAKHLTKGTPSRGGGSRAQRVEDYTAWENALPTRQAPRPCDYGQLANILTQLARTEKGGRNTRMTQLGFGFGRYTLAQRAIPLEYALDKFQEMVLPAWGDMRATDTADFARHLIDGVEAGLLKREERTVQTERILQVLADEADLTQLGIEVVPVVLAPGEDVPLGLIDHHIRRGKRAIYVRSPIGTGKTKAVAHDLRASQYPLLVACTHRRSLAAQLAGRLDAVYDKDATVRWDKPRQVMVLNSIHHRPDEQDVGAVLVIDEAWQVFDYLATATTFVNQETQQDARQARTRKLSQIAQKALATVMMDADLNVSTVLAGQCITGAELGEAVILDVQATPRLRGTAQEYHSLGHMLQEMLRLAEEGRSMAIACDTRRNATTLAGLFTDRFPEKLDRILSIHGDNSGRGPQQRFLADPTNASQNLDILIYSPSVGSGVSIEGEHQFDYVFGIFENYHTGGTQTGTHGKDWAQQMGRVRQPLTINYWVADRPAEWAGPLGEDGRAALTVIDMAQYYRELIAQRTQLTPDSLQRVSPFLATVAPRLAILANCLRYDSVAQFREAMSSGGWELTTVDLLADCPEYKTAKDRTQVAKLLAAMSLPTPKEVAALRLREDACGNLTTEDRMVLLRRDVSELTGYPNPSEAVYEFVLTRGSIRAGRGLKALAHPSMVARMSRSFVHDPTRTLADIATSTEDLPLHTALHQVLHRVLTHADQHEGVVQYLADSPLVTDIHAVLLTVAERLYTKGASDSVLTQPIAKYKTPGSAVNRVLSYLGLDVVGAQVRGSNLPVFLTSLGDIQAGKHKLYTLSSEALTTWWRTNHRLHGGYLHALACSASDLREHQEGVRELVGLVRERGNPTDEEYFALSGIGPDDW